MSADSKKSKKSKFKRGYRYWLLINLAVVLVVFILLLHKPADYRPSDVVPAGHKRGQVSTYLTHELMPKLYNGAQRQEPFYLRISQKGINDVICRSEWSRGMGGSRFSAPVVLFVPDKIIFMGTTSIKGVDFIVTIVVKPHLDKKGLLNLPLTKMKIGAVNVTFPARIMARRMYLERLAQAGMGTQDLQRQVAAALLSGESFEPVFNVDDKRVRVKKISVDKGKMVVRLVPASSN